MVITLGTGSGAFQLAASPDPIPMVNLRINGDRLIQEEALYGAAAKAFFDRGNHKTLVTFDVTRLQPSQLAAESFLLLHETMFPATGLVTFFSGIVGQLNFTSYLVNAAVQSVASSISGCTTRHSYRILGGVMSLTPS